LLLGLFLSLKICIVEKCLITFFQRPKVQVPKLYFTPNQINWRPIAIPIKMNFQSFFKEFLKRQWDGLSYNKTLTPGRSRVQTFISKNVLHCVWYGATNFCFIFYIFFLHKNEKITCFIYLLFYLSWNSSIKVSWNYIFVIFLQWIDAGAAIRTHEPFSEKKNRRELTGQDGRQFFGVF